MSWQEETSITETKTVNQWASEIDAEWRKSVEGIINTGRLISEALTAIPHGEKAGFYELLPFTQQTCNKLLQIAEDSRIANYAHERNLPPSWTTLYELTKLDNKTWELADEQGKIFPDMQRKDVKLLQVDKKELIVKNLARLKKPPNETKAPCDCASEIFELIFKDYFEVTFEWESDSICMEASWSRTNGWESVSDNTFQQDLEGATNIKVRGRTMDKLGNIKEVDPVIKY